MKSENLSYIQATNGFGKIACYCAENNTDIIKFVEENLPEIQAKIHEVGGIILRNFSIRSVSEFSHLANIISPHLLDYIIIGLY